MSDWYCHVQGKTHGPYTPQQLKQLVSKQKLKTVDPVRKGTEGVWTPAFKINGLFSAEELAAFKSDPVAQQTAVSQLQSLNSAVQTPQKKLPQATPLQATPLQAKPLQAQPLSSPSAATASAQAVAEEEDSAAPLYRNPLVIACCAIGLVAVLGIGVWEVISVLSKPDDETIMAESTGHSSSTGDNSSASAGSAVNSTDGTDATLTLNSGTSNHGFLTGERKPKKIDPQKRAADENENAAVSETGELARSADPGEGSSTASAETSPTGNVEPGYTGNSVGTTASPGDPVTTAEPAPIEVAEQAPALDQAKIDEVVNAAKQSIVTLHVRIGDRLRIRTFGFLLYPSGLVVSTHPMLERPDEVLVIFPDNRPIVAAETMKAASNFGLYLIRVDEKDLQNRTMLKLADQPHQPGEPAIKLLPSGREILGIPAHIESLAEASALKFKHLDPALKLWSLSQPYVRDDMSLPLLNEKAEIIGLILPTSHPERKTSIGLPGEELTSTLAGTVPLFGKSPSGTSIASISPTPGKAPPTARPEQTASRPSQPPSTRNQPAVEEKQAVALNPNTRIAEMQKTKRLPAESR